MIEIRYSWVAFLAQDSNKIWRRAGPVHCVIPHMNLERHPVTIRMADAKRNVIPHFGITDTFMSLQAAGLSQQDMASESLGSKSEQRCGKHFRKRHRRHAAPSR